MTQLSELAETLEKIGRLAMKAGRLLRKAELEPLMEPAETGTGKKPPTSVLEVWEKLLEARAEFYRQKHGLASTHQIVELALTPQRIKLISGAVSRHGVERTKRAAIGLYLSEFHTGKNEHGKEYLEPERPFQIKAGVDAVDKFAAIYAETHKEY